MRPSPAPQATNVKQRRALQEQRPRHRLMPNGCPPAGPTGPMPAPFRHPTEPTMQLVTVLLLCLSEGVAKAQALPMHGKHEYLKCVKRWFKSACSAAPTPAVDIKILPSSPATFQEQWAAMYEAALLGRKPVPCPCWQKPV